MTRDRNESGVASPNIRPRRLAVGLRVLAVITFAAALALSSPSCKRDSESESKDSSKAVGSIDGRGMNVLLVSVDTTRADHLGCYGHPIVKTPNIDKFAAEGTRFAQCISSAPMTLPSHSTMMTGSYPFVHGVRYNAGYELSEENTTLAEIFKEAGYATTAEVAVTVMYSGFGIAQGFDHYGDVQDYKKPADEIKERFLAENMERYAEDINARGIELLTEHKDHKFFMFLHYFDPHKGYKAPPRFAQQYDNGYYAEIAYFDEQFGLLMDALRDLGLAEKTLVILVSDHGEGLGQHGEETHSFFIYDTTQHVPLMMRLPGLIPAGQVVDAQVRLIDLASTIVDFAGLEPTPEMQGVSLLPFIADPRLEVNLPCYADSISGKLIFKYSILRSLRVEGWKYIHSSTKELYNVAEDPGELVNLAGTEPRRLADMREQLRKMIADSPPPPGSRAGLSGAGDEGIGDLGALGYVGITAQEMPGSELDDFEPVGIDPKDRLVQIRLMMGAMGARSEGNFEAAEKLSRKLLELEPDLPAVITELAKLVGVQGRLDEAEPLYRRALELEPRDTQARIVLARILGIRGAYEEAEEQFRTVLETADMSVDAHFGLAEVLSEQERYDEAYRVYAEAAELATKRGQVLYKWGMAYRMAGRLEDALKKLEEAVSLEPDLVDAGAFLARTLRELDRLDEAIDKMTQLVEQHPDDPELRRILAAWYTQTGNNAAAITQFSEVLKLHPEAPEAHFNLGLGLLTADKAEESLPHLRKAIELKSDYGRALGALAQALEDVGQTDDALKTFEKALEATPRDVELYDDYAKFLDRTERPQEAVAVLRKGHEQVPDDPALANNLAWCLATSKHTEVRDGTEAVKLAEGLVAALGAENAATLDTLAAAYAEAGQFDKAVENATRAFEIARGKGREKLASRIAARLALYKKGRPFRDS